MPFLIFSNADVQFVKKELTWKTYTTAKALPPIQRIELIDKKKYAKVALNKNIEAFIVYISFLSIRSRIIIHLAREV